MTDNLTAHFAMGFSSDEKEELLSILPPKYAERVRTAHGFLVGPLPTSFALNPRHPNPEQLPNPSNVGRRVRTADGRVGVIRAEWVNGDDCSGSWGTLRYSFDGQQNNSMSVEASSCVFLDSDPSSQPTQPL